MDELTLPQPIAQPVKHPLLRRLGAFSVAHFAYSIVCFHLSAWLLPTFNGLVGALPIWLVMTPFVLILMALYIPLGFLFGRDIKSPVHTLREMAQATALETAIAWCWAAAVIAILFLAENEELVFNVGLPLVLSTFILAYPSSCLALFASLLPMGLSGDLPVPLILGAIPAGLLPPLLFNLGCLWAPKKQPSPPGTPAPETPAQKEDAGL